jgi:hypothetical protein
LSPDKICGVFLDILTRIGYGVLYHDFLRFRGDSEKKLILLGMNFSTEARNVVEWKVQEV